jgi:tripartite-type tricarboxylate transporter receptor subunit TctC
MMFAASFASAQTAGVGAWPTQKPIRLIAVFPPGGSVDQVARTLAPAL